MLNRLLFSRHLDDDETLVVVVHHHWIFGIKMLAAPVLSSAFAVAGVWYAPSPLVLYVFIAWLVVSLVWSLRNFFDYFLDAWIITDQGIIDVAWHGWFHRESTRVLYSDIQGVSYEINGIVPTVMRYGTLAVEKISTGAAMSLENVPRPRRVEKLILVKMEDYLHSKNLKDSKQVQELLSTILARKVQMEEIGMETDDEDDEG